jgi:hypothetical protein
VPIGEVADQNFTATWAEPPLGTSVTWVSAAVDEKAAMATLGVAAVIGLVLGALWKK